MDVHGQLNYNYPNPTAVNHPLLAQQQQILHQNEHLQRSHRQQVQSTAHSLSAPSQDTLHETSRIRGDIPDAYSHGPLVPHQNMHRPRRGAVDYSALYPTPDSFHMEDYGVADKYIPSSTDKVTSADHRPLDEIFGNPYSLSRWQCTGPGGSSSVHAQSPVYSSPPQGLSHPSQQYPQQLQQCGQAYPSSSRHTLQPVFRPAQPRPAIYGLLHIPLLQLDNHQRGSDMVINFRCWGGGMPVEGVSMSELLHGQAHALERGRDRIFDGFGFGNIKLNIAWPGYPIFAKSISPISPDGKPITRVELGYEVALTFTAFFCEITKKAIQPSHTGAFTIALVQNGSASSGIRFDHLRLFNVRETSLGEWTPEISAVVAG